MTAPRKPLGAGSAACQCFKLTYETLEGYANLLGRKLGQRASGAEYRLRGCLYNSSSREFIGRFHDTMSCSLIESLQSGAVICPLQQSLATYILNVWKASEPDVLQEDLDVLQATMAEMHNNLIAFFYCLHADPTHILITEITASYLVGDDRCELNVGWSMYPLFHQLSNAGQVKSGSIGALKTHSYSTRLPVYEGTPRALFSFKHPTPGSSYLHTVPGCILSMRLEPHPTMARAIHILPPLMLLGLGDVIPGLVPTRVVEAYPKLLKGTSYSLDKVSLLLLPSVDDFEEQMLAGLSEDLIYEGSGVDETSPFVIEERRLKVMVFNGWRFVGSPAIGYLDKISATGKTSGLSTATTPSTYNLRSNLILKGSLELSEMVSHELLEVVFQLEYTISWKTIHLSLAALPHSSCRRIVASISDRVKPPSLQSSTVPMCWAVWCPHASFMEDDRAGRLASAKQVAIEFRNGPGFIPDAIPCSAYNTCYKAHLGDAGKLTFRSTPSKLLSDGLEGSQLLHTSSTNNLSTDHADPVRPSDEGTPAHRFLVSSTPVRKGQGVAHPPPSFITPQHSPPVQVKRLNYDSPLASPYSWKTIPRSTMAYFHTSGLTDFKDGVGNSLPLSVDSTMKPTSGATAARAELADAHLEPHQIAVQFLGFKHSDNLLLSLSPEVQPLTHLNFELHLYNFPAAVLHCLLKSPPTHSPHLPLFLHITQSTARTHTDSACHYFPVSPQCFSTAQHSRFVAFMKHGHINVAVYDAVSIILLGMAHVPLASLCSWTRDAPSYVQQAMSCPVVIQDSSISSHSLEHSTCFSKQEGSSVKFHIVGQLFLRLAKLPPRDEDITGPHSFPAVSKLSPEKPVSCVARRLYGSHTPWRSEVKVNGGSTLKEAESTRSRKHSRMQRVREAKLRYNSGEMLLYNHKVSDVSMESSSIDLQREELKYERISCVLQEALTTHYLLRPLAGQALYLEHIFTNTHNQPLAITIVWKNSDLRLVTDKRECQYLRRFYSMKTAHADADVVTEGESRAEFGFFVHQGEIVTLPFRYQNFGMTPGGVLGEAEHHMRENGEEVATKIKVYLHSSPQDIVGILDLQIKPVLQRVDRVFHFHHPERTFLKKSVEVDTSHPLFLHMPPSLRWPDGGLVVMGGEDGLEEEETGEREVYVCSSDHDIMCEIRKANGKTAVYLKALVRPCPSVQQLTLFLYRQSYQVFPSEVWLVAIHSAYRISHLLTLGQASMVKLLVRGDHVHRRVSCYCYTAPTMTVVSARPFLLNAHSLHEVQLSLRTLTLHSQIALVSIVESGGRQVGGTRHLIGLWLVEMSVQEPVVTRAFQISLPAGDSINERSITFTNPYPMSKDYLLYTDHPNVITFKEKTAKLEPQETAVLFLQFQPSSYASSEDVLVFINDLSDQIEECFLIKVIYGQS